MTEEQARTLATSDDAARRVFEEATAIQVHDPELKAYIDSGYPAPAGALAGGVKQALGQPFVMNEAQIPYQIPLTQPDMPNKLPSLGDLERQVQSMGESAQAAIGAIDGAVAAVKNLQLAEEFAGTPAIDKGPPPTLVMGIDPSGEETDLKLGLGVFFQEGLGKQTVQPGSGVLSQEQMAAAWEANKDPIAVIDSYVPVEELTGLKPEVKALDKKEDPPFGHETHEQHLQKLREGVNQLLVEEARTTIDPVAPHLGRTKVGTVAHVSTGPMGRAALSAVLAQALLPKPTTEAERSAQLLHDVRLSGLKQRLKALFSGNGKDLKRKLRRLKDQDFGAVMDVKLALPAGVVPGQKGPGTVDGHVLLQWVYRTNEYRNLGMLGRILGLNDTGFYGRPWTFELAANLTGEIVWMLVLLVPGMVKSDDEMTADHKLDCIALAVDGVERALTGRVAL